MCYSKLVKYAQKMANAISQKYQIKRCREKKMIGFSNIRSQSKISQQKIIYDNKAQTALRLADELSTSETTILV